MGLIRADSASAHLKRDAGEPGYVTDFIPAVKVFESKAIILRLMLSTMMRYYIMPLTAPWLE